MNRPAGEEFEASLGRGPSPRGALIELGLFLALVLSYIWLWSGAFDSSWVVIGVVGLGFTMASHWIHGESPRDLGFRLDTLGAAARAAAVPVVPVVAFLILVGAINGHLNAEFLRPERWVKLIGWALLQQYLLQSFIHRRVAVLVGRPVAREAAVAAIFALLHLPNPLLVPITFVAGYVFSMIFRRAPNLYVLALCQAVGSSAVFFGLDPESLHRMRVGPGYYRV